MSEAELIRALADRQAITELLYRYCRAVDRIDEALGRSVFHPDATAAYGDFFNGSAHGMIAAVCESHRACITHSHQVTNVVIDLQGERAGSEAYHLAAIRMWSGDRLMQVTTWGRYLDTWSRRDGRWGVEHRQVLRDLDQIAEVTPLTPGETARDRSCPSYVVLGLAARSGP